MRDGIAISVKKVTKTYRLYNNQADRVKEAFHPFRKKYHHNFNALSDVNLDIKKGETYGIIGRNGSGKSTLLQIICGILQPTSGRIYVNGRVSALLELGAGFNPEFTGYHNVYINGSIFGLSREVINARFDEIVAFADIGDFINQPVKSYSSGMVVRLAFAVAISIDPDILIVDEALAVGDEAFQRKCFARLKQIQERGGTILFVSHGAATVVELCNRALLLEQGEHLLSGSPKQVISHYHKMIFAPPAKIEAMKEKWRLNPNRFNLVADDETDENEDAISHGDENRIENDAIDKFALKSFYVPDMKPKSTVYYEKQGAVIENPHITTLEGRQVNMLVNKGEYVYTYSVYFERPAFQARFGMLIKTISGFEIGGHVSAAVGEGVEYIEKTTRWRISFGFRCRLNPGVYFLNAGVLAIIAETEVFLDRNIDIAMFRVQEDQDSTSTSIVDLIDVADVAMVEKGPEMKAVET